MAYYGVVYTLLYKIKKIYFFYWIEFELHAYFVTQVLIFSEYFVYTSKHTTRKFKIGRDSCYSLRTNTSQKLQRKKSQELSAIESLDLKDLRELICTTQNKSCKKTTLCVSTIGCFCWMGWWGDNCENSKYHFFKLGVAKFFTNNLNSRRLQRRFLWILLQQAMRQLQK